MDPFSGPQNRQPQMPQIRLEDMDFNRIGRFVRWALLALGVILLWWGVNWGRGFYVDWLWFGNLGYETVLLRVMTARVALFLIGAVLFVGLAAPNLYAAHRNTGRMPQPSGSVLPPEAYASARKLMVWVAGGFLLLAAVLMAVNPASEWEKILLFLNALPFNETDPIFGRDFSFYIFTLPALSLARSWLLSAVVVLLLVVAVFYYLTFTLRGERFSLSGSVKTHLALLVSLLFVLIAAGHWLSRYDLLYSPTGAVFGVGYTDDHITLPARTFMTFVALAAAALFVVTAFSDRKRLIIYAVGGWVALNLLGGSVLPALVQRLQVEPSELAKERPYLASNIDFTRRAYGLTKLKSQSHPARGNVDRETIAENQGTIQNVRLWDEGPLLQSYNQIQFFRLYYDFLAVHTDRYRVGDELRQVMMATRELSADKLPAEAQRWVNRHLQFTHGYGVAMSPVTEVEAGGRPSFFIRDVPPRGEISLERPDIYYGLKSLNYLIVNSRMEEFNYPGPDGPVYTRYQGDGGVEMSSFFRRLLFAWEFMDLNILISGEINPDSLIQFRRTVQERFSTVAPFLLRDREAYSVVADGRLFWIQDAYTYTNRYPYSTRWSRSFNYLRNSVKGVIDAYHGSLDYYVADPEDPMIQTYQAIFPDLFKPMDEMPEHLRTHVRYPLDQFTVQTEMLLQYHMQDPVVFYNKEDQWSIPMQNSFGQSQELKPYYIVARLPGEETEEFILIQPFTPQNRHNLVGWMAARSDGEHYGELVLFDFPSGRHVDGPNQVEARIDNDAVISEQFTLWGQVGSEVRRGILLVIPVGDALLYAEPVFLKPETLEFPELRRIIMADATKVVMHQSLEDSVDALVGKLPPVAPVAEDVEEPVQAAERAPARDKLGSVRRGLEQGMQKLQEVLGTLKE
ncbi:MAG: UPF0182 family protein [Deltaproteobacteria bacterium]|nr:UPF0182 family protein [Deltaproteobacteria bacterium]